MKKTTSKTLVADYLVRFRTRIESDPTENTQTGQILFLNALLSAPGLLQCGDRIFQHLNLYYNGTSWVCDLESVVEEDVGTKEPKE